jgi:hypothetical protein
LIIRDFYIAKCLCILKISLQINDIDGAAQAFAQAYPQKMWATWGYLLALVYCSMLPVF